MPRLWVSVSILYRATGFVWNLSPTTRLAQVPTACHPNHCRGLKWSPISHPFPGVCSLHSRHCVSAQNCSDFHLTVRRVLKSFERSAWKVLRHPPSLTCMQTHLPQCLPLCTPLPSLALRKVQASLLWDVCICCSLSLEHPSANICLGCFFTPFSLLLPVTAPTICHKLATSAT